MNVGIRKASLEQSIGPLRGALVLAFALLAQAWAGDASALRCHGRVVSEGDHRFEVEERCGEPYWVETYSEYIVVGEFAPRPEKKAWRSSS